MDPGKNLNYVSPSCERITEYPADMLIENPALLTEMVHPDDRELLANHLDYSVDSPGTIEMEFRIITRTGKERWIAHTCQPIFDADGVCLGRRASNRDITERKLSVVALQEAEEKFRTIVEGLRREHFFYSHDTNGLFTYLSPSVTEVLGYLSEELVAKIEDYITDNPINEAAKHLTKLTLRGKQQSSFELEVYHKDGSCRLLEVTNTPVFDANGIVVGVGGVAHDITERKNMEAALKERVDELAGTRRAILNMMEDLGDSRQKADEANQAKGDFLANMSHEIRTPMNAVIGMSHLALKTDLTSKQRDYLTKIQSSANSLLGIINDILDFSKIEAGKLDMESVDFDLDDVLENLANLVTVKAREKEDLEILFSTGSDVPKSNERDSYGY